MLCVAVDWSGRVGGERHHLWTATARDGELLSLGAGRSRAEVVDDLCRLFGEGGELTVGLDFAFSFPRWFVDSLGCSSAPELWAVVAERGEGWLAACEPPFWGRPGRRRPELVEHLRRTDRAASVGAVAAKSVFQIAGAGAVGTGSLRGMGYLATLRAAGYAIWPFDPPGAANVVEIYPRLFTGPVAKSRRDARRAHVAEHAPQLRGDALEQVVASEDAFDAAISALEMSRQAEALRHLDDAPDALARLEGEIWRPPPPASGGAGERPRRPPVRRRRGRLSLGRIAEAARVIDPVFLDSPQLASASLGERLGCALTVKVETLNPIRSFKGRGADYLVHRLVAEADGGGPGPLACVSAGNFGQGLAYAGRRRGLEVHVFAAETANANKVAAMRRLGADVELHGEDFDAAKAAGRRAAAEHGWCFVEDGEEPAISEGAGTIALELTRDQVGGAYDAVVLPVGNGALAAGMGTWLRARARRTRLIGVCAAGAPAMALSFRAGRPVETASAATIADGIAVRVPVAAAVADLDGLLDDLICVDDDEIVAAMGLVADELGLVAEPAGAAGVAGVVRLAGELVGARVATVLCGSNLAPSRSVAER